MTKPSEPDLQPREADRLIFAGLLGLAAAGVLQMMEKGGDLGLEQQVGIHAFALAIPLLAVGLIVDCARRAETVIPWWYDFIGLVGSVSAVIGFGGLLFHFGFSVGTIFMIGCVIGFVLVRRL